MAKLESSEERRTGWGWGWKAWTMIFMIGVIVATLGSPFIFQLGIFNVSSHKLCFCKNSHKFSGLVEDCCCDYKTVDTLNRDVLHPLLHDLVKTPFFRYFKVKLWCDCPFWPDDGMCHLRDCSVCECPEQEFPEPFKRPESQLSEDDLVCQEGKPHSIVDRTLDRKAFRGWIETDNPWTSDNETDNAELTYVNLQLNSERYTGYTGPSARRIWESIYKDHCLKAAFGVCLVNCSCYNFGIRAAIFGGNLASKRKTSASTFCLPGDASPERRVFYKLISGLHSSISAHIASKYLLDETKDIWGPNLSLLYERVLKYPERISNLYFTFLFVLRAVTKAGQYLSEAEYSTGNPVEDQLTLSLVNRLVNNKHLQAACPLPFDEAKLWKGQNGDELKRQMQIRFRNISALMDCVGCERCRLWGKLQILGLGTALKILFSIDGNDPSRQPLQLQRNEVIALINLLNQLSDSVQVVHALSPIVEKSVKENLISEPRIQSV